MTTIMNAVQDTHVVVFNLFITSMSADRQVDLSDVGVEVNTLPADAKTLVESSIYPKEFLRKYSLIREQAVAELGKGAATNISMGTVTSRSVAVEKIAALTALKAKWEATLDEDAPVYEAMCAKHMIELSQKAIAEGGNPKQVHLLTELLIKRQPSWEEVRPKMSFKFTVTPVTLDEKDFDPVLFAAQRDSVIALREGVMGSLLQFVCREASELLKVVKQRNSGKSEYTLNHRTAERVVTMTKKLHGLAFVHGDIKPLADGIDAALAFMPSAASGKEVKLSSDSYHNLTACLEALADQTLVADRLKKGLPLVTVVTTSTPVVVVAASAVQAAQTTSVASQPAVVQTTQSAPAQQVVAAQSTLSLTAVQVDEEKAESEAHADDQADLPSTPVVTPVTTDKPRMSFF